MTFVYVKHIPVLVLVVLLVDVCKFNILIVFISEIRYQSLLNNYWPNKILCQRGIPGQRWDELQAMYEQYIEKMFKRLKSLDTLKYNKKLFHMIQEYQ